MRKSVRVEEAREYIRKIIFYVNNNIFATTNVIHRTSSSGMNPQGHR